MTQEPASAGSSVFAVPLTFSQPVDAPNGKSTAVDTVAPGDEPGPPDDAGLTVDDAPELPLVALLAPPRATRRPTDAVRADVRALIAASGRRQAGPAVRYSLTVVDGRRVDLEERAQVVIGRQPDLALSVDDSLISRRHCSVEVVDGTLQLTDLGSTNGTWINRAGTRIDAVALRATQLFDGDWVFGDEVPLVRVDVSGSAE